MKRFLIHVSTYWCGMGDTFRAVAEDETQLWDLAEELAYQNFQSYGLAFNRTFSSILNESTYFGKISSDDLISIYKKAIKAGAMFDARCFNIPKEEVTNCILWRQQDATRNSISSAGQANFSHKQLEGLNSNQIQELLFQEKGINWNDYPTKFKRGELLYKEVSSDHEPNSKELLVY